MILVNLAIGCIGFMLAGNAFTRFKDTHEATWAILGVIEVLIGGYFIVSSIGIAA